jgi:hypothetical protein
MNQPDAQLSKECPRRNIIHRNAKQQNAEWPKILAET